MLISLDFCFCLGLCLSLWISLWIGLYLSLYLGLCLGGVVLLSQYFNDIA